MKYNSIAKWWMLAAVLMFAAATFQIVREHFLLGAVSFGATACCPLRADTGRKRQRRTAKRKRNPVLMKNKVLVVIDVQNDITEHYREIIGRRNAAIDWAKDQGMAVVYIKHNNLSTGTRTFKPGTKGAELVQELKIVSDNVFIKTKANALTSDGFSEFIRENGIDEFFITGADAGACVKSTCFNAAKAEYTVHVISDCVTSYDPKKLPEMLAYYADRGCEVRSFREYQEAGR